MPSTCRGSDWRATSTLEGGPDGLETLETRSPRARRRRGDSCRGSCPYRAPARDGARPRPAARPRSATRDSCCSARRRTARRSSTPGAPRSRNASSRSAASRSSPSRATGPTAIASTATCKAMRSARAAAPRRCCTRSSAGRPGCGRIARSSSSSSGSVRTTRQRSRSDAIGFYGLDVYSLWDSMRAVMDYPAARRSGARRRRRSGPIVLRAVRRGRAGVCARDGARADVVRGRGRVAVLRELRANAPHVRRR